MLDKKISVSEQVSNMPVEAQLLFTWAIPHADDVGFLPRSHKTLKAMVLPMMNLTPEEFDRLVVCIVEQELWKEVKYGSDKFYHMSKFREHQTLKKDRQPQTLLQMTFHKDPKESWTALEDILEGLGIHLEDNGFQLDTEVKRSEVKRRQYTEGAEKDFDAFWKEYPRKIAKPNAQRAFAKALGKSNLKAILAGLAKWKVSRQWTKDGGEFIPHPATWLNQERWNDEPQGATTRKSDAF